MASGYLFTTRYQLVFAVGFRRSTSSIVYSTRGLYVRGSILPIISVSPSLRIPPTPSPTPPHPNNPPYSRAASIPSNLVPRFYPAPTGIWNRESGTVRSPRLRIGGAISARFQRRHSPIRPDVVGGHDFRIPSILAAAASCRAVCKPPCGSWQIGSKAVML